ncbi:Cox family DNA-binding protein, partial [Enterococcus faecalis]|uniref:Cox family DNA-binding protein n=1 Tax=Enterococcus faecalis TaxID=1351 RepID=UPI001C8F20B0
MRVPYMDAENYVIQYPLDAVHVDKFADLLGKPKTAVSEMVKANKLPIIELRDPCKPKARAGEKWVFITAWASTWRIPQFKTVGLPTMGAYRELRKLPRGVSIADEF